MLLHRRAAAIGVCGFLALGSATGLVQILAAANPTNEPDLGRPLSPVEANRLARMRLHNYTDALVAVHATVGRGDGELRLAGWVDWRQPLVYLSVTGRQPGPVDGLIQAVPGTVGIRPGGLRAAEAAPTTTADSAVERTMPPLPPPNDGWRVRRFDPAMPASPASEVPAGQSSDVLAGPALDTTLALLFQLAADRPEAAQALLTGQARWLRADHINGISVDVLLGPATPVYVADPSGLARDSNTSAAPTTSPMANGLAGQGAAVRYWLDANGRLHRLEAQLAPDTPIVLDMRREVRIKLTPVDILGGRPVTPRPVTAAEATLLTRLRGRPQPGGSVSIHIPAADLTVLIAAGWLNGWARVVYLAVRDTASGGKQTLLRADMAGVWRLPGQANSLDGRPPLPVPPGAWQHTSWTQRGDASGSADLDLLIQAALGWTGTRRPGASEVRRTAAWLRADTIDGLPVAVYELPDATEQGQPMGSRRLRYWVDSSGVLRRVEVRAHAGGFGRLDLMPGTAPYLAPVRTRG